MDVFWLHRSKVQSKSRLSYIFVSIEMFRTRLTVCFLNRVCCYFCPDEGSRAALSGPQCAANAFTPSTRSDAGVSSTWKRGPYFKSNRAPPPLDCNSETHNKGCKLSNQSVKRVSRARSSTDRMGFSHCARLTTQTS